MKVRKNTYEISTQFLSYELICFFTYQKSTPLPIISINGNKVHKKDSEIPTIFFPTPAIHEIATVLCDTYSPKTKFSTTIVEYFDKHNQPILYLFPNGTIFEEAENSSKKMNNFMRRDLIYQARLRQSMLEKAKRSHRR